MHNSRKKPRSADRSRGGSGDCAAPVELRLDGSTARRHSVRRCVWISSAVDASTEGRWLHSRLRCGTTNFFGI